MQYREPTKPRKKKEKKAFLGIVWRTPDKIVRNKRFKLSCSFSASFICESWFVKQGECSKVCSNVGGTVTETCQCSSNSVAISERSVCENYGLHTTRTKSCKERCPTSGLQQNCLPYPFCSYHRDKNHRKRKKGLPPARASFSNELY